MDDNFNRHLIKLLMSRNNSDPAKKPVNVDELYIKDILEFIKALNVDIERSERPVNGWYVFECTTSGTWMGDSLFDGSVYFKPDNGEPELVLIVDEVIV